MRIFIGGKGDALDQTPFAKRLLHSRR